MVVDANDYVQIAWDDTLWKGRIGLHRRHVRLMYSEWADICTVIYGGNFASGPYFQGTCPCSKKET